MDREKYYCHYIIDAEAPEECESRYLKSSLQELGSKYAERYVKQSIRYQYTHLYFGTQRLLDEKDDNMLKLGFVYNHKIVKLTL